jgi:hypothetical protein
VRSTAAEHVDLVGQLSCADWARVLLFHHHSSILFLFRSFVLCFASVFHLG